MEIKIIPLGHIQANCYLLSTDKAAVIIDPGFDSCVVNDFLKDNKNKERIILLTHAHFDHIGGALNLREETGTQIAVGIHDNPALSDTSYNLSDQFHAKLIPFSADILLKDGEEFTVGDLTFKVIHTPGHTIGGVCYLIDNVLFSGDTLFAGSNGRTDFPGGDYTTLESSVKKLYKLDGSIIVLPGHGGETTIEHEKIYNQFIRG